MYRGESLSIIWFELCGLVARYPDLDWESFFFVYDNYCHLYTFLKNRADVIPGITDRIAEAKGCIDQFHETGHKCIQNGKKTTRV